MEIIEQGTAEIRFTHPDDFREWVRLHKRREMAEKLMTERAMARLVKDGMPAEQAERALSGLPMTLHELDYDLAIQAGAMFARTRAFGLSLGDRACLALAARERLPAMTADRIWAQAGPLVGVEVRLIR